MGSEEFLKKPERNASSKGKIWLEDDADNMLAVSWNAGVSRCSPEAPAVEASSETGATSALCQTGRLCEEEPFAGSCRRDTDKISSWEGVSASQVNENESPVVPTSQLSRSLHSSEVSIHRNGLKITFHMNPPLWRTRKTSRKGTFANGGALPTGETSGGPITCSR